MVKKTADENLDLTRKIVIFFVLRQNTNYRTKIRTCKEEVVWLPMEQFLRLSGTPAGTKWKIHGSLILPMELEAQQSRDP